VILGETSPDHLDQPIYFMTDDEPSRGADQTEAYNVSRDPLELDNLVTSSDAEIKARLRQLEALLNQQCHRKRLKPRSGVVPGQPDC
jgi:hypothetical protein